MSVIVPTLEEEAMIGSCLAALAALPGRFEVIVADGGSGDRTRAIAAAHPVVHAVLGAPRGRARQMNAGAAHADGDVLLFLHADTRLPADAWRQIASSLADATVSGGNFRLEFGEGGAFGRLLALVYAIQRRGGVFYGDSAIWVRAEVFRRLGGFPDQPIMEDFEMARRIARHGRAVCLPGPAVTSSRRWRRGGLVRTIASWLIVRALYQCRVPAERLARIYRIVR